MISVPSPAAFHVREFCRAIRQDTTPSLVPVRPAADAEVSDCFANVRREAERSGGRIVFGWAIWEWTNIYIEGEHHAVYEEPSGALIDVTPSLLPHITHVLFLPDDSAPYDFANEGVRRDNHRRALKNDPLIEKLFATKKAYDDIFNAIPGVGMVSLNPHDARKLQVIQRENTRAIVEIGMKYTKGNDTCFCGSGKKFKKCHSAAREAR